MSPKIIHVVLLSLDPVKFAECLSAPELHRILEAIRKTVPGVIELNFGPSSTNVYEGYVDCSDGYTHCLVSKHIDGAALKTYSDHPCHMELVEGLKSCITKPVLRFDYELGE